MRLTVRQLKGLIREAISEAHDDMTGDEITDGGRGQIHYGGASKSRNNPKVLRLAKKAVRELDLWGAETVLSDLEEAGGGPWLAGRLVTDVISAIKDIDENAFEELQAVWKNKNSSREAELDFRRALYRRY